MSPGRKAIVLSALCVALAGAIALVLRLVTPPAQPRADAPASSAATGAEPRGGAGTTPRDERAATTRAGKADATERAARVQRWKRLLADVSRARARRTGTAGDDSPPAGDSPPAATLDRDYIRARISDLHDLLVECYDMAATAGQRPEGRLVVEFTIASEPDVGGVVTESRVDPERSSTSVATDPVLAECVQESMYAADFAAATTPGEVHVTYPFVFRRGEPDGG